MNHISIEKPYYKLGCNIFTSAEIYVNDVLIQSFMGEKTSGDDRISSILPINQVVLESGRYFVKGKMYPRYGEKFMTEDNSYLGLDFELCNISNCKETNVVYHPKIESPWDGLSEGIKYPYFEISTEIEVELPFVLDGWQNSVDLSKIKEQKLFEEVFSFYTQLHAVVRSHNVSKFLELSKEKMTLQEQAFYFSEERKKSFMDGAVGLFSQKLDLLPLDPTDMKLIVMGHGKLVKLLRKDHTEVIQFKSPNPEEQSNIELEVKLHMRNKKLGFSII